MPTARKPARRPTPILHYDVVLQPDQEMVVQPDPPDPAALLAEKMLVRAVAAVSTDRIKPGSVVIVRTPGAEWTDAVVDAWASVVQGGHRPWMRTEAWWRERDGWLALTGEDAGDGSVHGLLTANSALTEVLWRGKSAVGFSPDPDALLPREILREADILIGMDGPLPEDVAGVAACLAGGRATATLGRVEAAALTPQLVRMARRLGQSADDYVARLSRLLAPEQVAGAPPRRAGTLRDSPTLERLHGMAEATAWGFDVVADLAEYSAGRLAWSDVGGHACLLSGPPGCGKTVFAAALAASCGVPLVTGSYGQWHSAGNAHQGELLKAMRKTFDEAKKAKPSILFIDEIDSFPDRGTLTHAWADWEIQVVNALLELLDGAAGREGVVVVAACNHAHLLDPALVRSGRLDRHIRISLPDREGLEAILREHLGENAPPAGLPGLALRLAGSTGADVERLVRGARAKARRAGRALAIGDLLDEAGAHDGRSAEQLWRAAVHEAGHALALCEHAPGTLEAVSLRASEGQGGVTVSEGTGGPVLPGDIHRQLACMLAGRAAEQSVFGQPSSGAGGGSGSDLAQATMLAAVSASAMGFAACAGLAWSGMPTVATLPGMLAGSTMLRAEVGRMLDEAYAAATELVCGRKQELLAIAEALLGEGALDADGVMAAAGALAQEARR